MPIAVTIDSPTGAPVSNVYLAVNSYPSGLVRGRPDGKIKILSEHKGVLQPGQTLAAIWTPETLFATNRLDLTLDYGIGDSGLGMVISRMTVA